MRPNSYMKIFFYDTNRFYSSRQTHMYPWVYGLAYQNRSKCANENPMRKFLYCYSKNPKQPKFYQITKCSPYNNVNALTLARMHRWMRSSSFEIGVQYHPPAFGRRVILHPNFSGHRTVFTDTSSPESTYSLSECIQWYSWIKYIPCRCCPIRI